MPDGIMHPQTSNFAQITNGDDFIRLLCFQYLTSEGPFERFGQYLVEIGDEIQNLRAQVRLRCKTTSPDHFTHQNAEPDLYLV